MSASGIVVTLQHLRECGVCFRGSRAKAPAYGVDWDRLRKGGIPVEELEATGHAVALRVCRHARKQAAQQGQG